jgi:hypothetical protein
MNAKSLFLTTTLAYIFLVTISGCSESTKEADPLPELISSVNFPFIKNNSLYSFDPETGESETLFTAEKELILALDTDASSKEKNEDNSLTFKHTSTAEYFAYANAQTLHLYDIETRIDHQLYDFRKDIIFDPESNTFVTAPESYICDIQKIVTWDEESRLAKRVLYKDELSIYVKTSTNKECQNTETPFSYWQINIEESSEQLSRRRKILLEHSHDHTHFHDHNDESSDLFSIHEHTHALKENELDENNIPFNPNYHEHNHNHTHDFLFTDEHAHEHLTRSEVDAVHNNPINQEIMFETHPKLIGKKTTVDSLDGTTIDGSTDRIKVKKVDEALMYSGKPIVDIPNRRFGYLGFNTTENTLKFYSVINPDDNELKKKLLWQLTSNNFNAIDNDHSTLSDLEKLTPKYNRFSNFQYAEENIFITTNNKIFFFSLADLFDDDAIEERESSLSNPLFTSGISEPTLSDRANYNPLINKMAITEGLTVLSIDFSNNSGIPEQASRIIQLNEQNLNSISASYISSNSILIEKQFNENNTNQNSIAVLQNTGLEVQTVLTKTPDTISSTVLNNEAFINLRTGEFQNRSSEYFAPDFHSTVAFSESIWGSDGVDYRNNMEQFIVSIASSETSATEINSIASPKLYLLDDDLLDRSEDFGYIPSNIINIEKVVIFTELYGLIEVMNTDLSKSIYFFARQKSSFNFNNEYKVMKLLQAPTIN